MYTAKDIARWVTLIDSVMRISSCAKPCADRNQSVLLRFRKEEC